MQTSSTIAVTVVATPNALDPYTRTITPVTVAAGSTVRDLIPDGWGHEEGETLAFLGATRCEDLDTEVKQGELLHFFGGVTDPVSLVLIAIAVVSAVVSISMMPDVPTTQPAPNPDGSSAYGYYGFSNSFRAEGDPVPVVYGKMRVAPPVINQVISANGISQQLALSVREDLYCLLAISEGPILGVGIYEGVVENDADQDALIGLYGSAQAGTGLQINGIPATNFIGGIDWRTGTLNQEPLLGSSGYITYTDTSVVYEISLTPTNGNVNAIDDAAFPTGVFAVGSASLVSNNNALEYVEQDILTQVDRALVQITFARGLYSQSGGGFQAESKDIRIQYRETDSSGVGTGSYVLLPCFTVQSASTVPQLIDIPVSFVRPETYVPSAIQGYHRSDSTNHLANTAAAGVSKVLPSNWTLATQQWTLGMWFNARDVAGTDGANKFLFGVSSPGATNNIAANATNYRDIDVDSIGTSEYGFQITMRSDVSGTIGAANQIYLELEMWMPSVQMRKGVYRAAVGASSDYFSSSSPLGEWRHVALVFDGQAGGATTNVTAVIDGILSYPMTFIEYRSAGFSALGQSAYWPYWSSANVQLTVGALQQHTSTTNQYASKQDMAELFLYDGVLDSGKLNLLGNSGLELDMFGNKTSGVLALLQSDPNAKMLVPMNGYETDSGTEFYRNYASNPAGTVKASKGDLELTGSVSASKTIDGPIWSRASGSPKKSYWQVEVYVSQQLSSNTSSNVATISSVTGLSSQPYAYTSTAIASVNVEANEQVNNQQPQMTMLVKGRIVNTWGGSVDAEGKPALTPAWSRNPAWIAADLLTHPRYGLGAELTSDAIDWPSFLSWADFCDEGVPDAFGELGFFGIRAEGSAVTSTEQLLRIYVGLQDTAGGTANPEYTIPKSWRVKDPVTGANTAFASVTGVTDGGLSDQWVTSDDISTGLNQASNQLGIYSIEYFEGPFHGYDAYAVVKLRWNRLDANGVAVWPSGITAGDEFFADDLGLLTLGTCSGYEARCRFDGVFDQKEQSAWEAVLQVFTAGRAMPIKAGRKIIAIPDRPRSVVGVFGQGNIVTDTLELTYTGPKQRPNSVEGDILDEHSNYEKRTVLVDHPSVQDPTLFESFRKERADFRGVVRASQAMRDATYRLNRYHLVRRNAKFEVGPDAVNLLPGDRILVSHDVPQYGYSGRLRADMVIANTYPNGGSLYNSWDLQGGANALTQGALITEDTGAGTPVSASYSASLLRSLPTTSDATSIATSQGADGSDFGSGGLHPGWVTQFVATSPQLYPPNSTIAPLAQIDSAGYTCEFSVYVKEPALGASEVVRLNVYRLVDASGTPIDTAYVSDFTWSGGAISSTYTSTGITASATLIGSGWYRIAVVYDNAVAGGAVGDYLQARIMMPTTSGGGVGAGHFDKVASGGKGINFLKHGDPLDCTKSNWTRYNDGTSGIDIDNVAFAPPFYTPTDGSYGQVARLFKPGAIAFGTTPPNLVQTHTLTTGSGVANWDNETITLSGYARVGPSNGASNTTMYVSLRFANTVDSNNKLNGDGVTATFTTSAGGGSWAAFSTPSKTEASGTVNSTAHSVAAVRHNSSTNDANWVEWSVDVAYTPSAGTNTAISVGVFTDSGGSGSGGDTELYVWGLRLHGESASGTKVSPYYHKQMLATSAMFQKGTGVGFQEGGTVKLDRDVTLEAGNSYELLLRSSFSPNAILNSDNSQVVAVDGSEVPASGSTTKAANSDLKIMRPTQFTPHEGDLYSFGKSSKTSEDFVITRISLDPGTMHRTIECEEYNEAIYEDTGFGTTGTDTVSDLPSPEATASAMAQMGVGSGSNRASLANRASYIEVLDESRTDEGGNFVPMVEVRWQLPRGVRQPKEVRLYYQRETLVGVAGDPPIYIGTVPASLGFFQYSNPTLLRGKEYRFYVQPVGYAGSATAVKASPSKKVRIRKVASPFAMSPPAVTTATRGWQQLYKLERVEGERTVDVVEGRIGGWKLGRPAFVIDPDVANTASDSTLVGQASTRLGVTEMQVYCRGRSGQGHYGQASVVRGTEQLTDILFDHSTEASNDYAAAGAISAELSVGADGVMSFDASSTALEATYLPAQISLGSKPQRVLMNCVPAAFQLRPEALEELPYELGSETLRRWSFEGPMDDLARGECSLKVDWRWSSTASASSKDFREFRPGEVYARTIDFRITFIRPNANFNIRMERLVVQALLPPNYSPADVDGGTFA